jgi:DMSO/TMAO reductase YedYZ molybdopterin-dependent catalytic subunit
MRGASTTGLVGRGTSLEPVTAHLGVDSTPVDDFFVCKVGEAARPDPESWRMTIDGDGVSRVVELDLDDLVSLPRRRVDAWLECAGNGRSLFDLVGGRPLAPENNATPWMLGAMAMATWEGPSLSAVLERAGLEPDAAWVSPAGLDVSNSEGEPVRMCLPMEKAAHPDTIVALVMNGEPLEPMHGFPARLLVPGWIGAYSVKWLERIEVSTSWVSAYRADTYYRHRSPDGTDLGPATTHPVKSSLALPWPARLAVGPSEILGYARVGEGHVVRVEWWVDGGDLRQARLLDRVGEWGWQPFTFQWEATAGDHTLSTRATTATGATQPDEMPFHPSGLLWNAVIPHPVLVGPDADADRPSARQ